ncbi:Ras-related GTP-binding protein D [Blattella germanica]|nr:Ras-related GTP-binding protein D [Blattella germanica]
MSYGPDENEQYPAGYDVGSFPKDFGYGGFDQDGDGPTGGPLAGEQKPRILLMGLRRSGKSSIQKVVFHKMSPNETLFLESTNKIIKDDISNSSFVQFQIWDFPGQIDFFDATFDSDMIFGGCGALVFVLDAQDDYMEALNKLNLTVTKAFKVNQAIRFEVFIHKVDGLSDDYKMETQRDIHQRANDDLADSAIEKAFLFDVVSKIYIATDSSPVDMQSYELCCDMIDVVIDVSCIYGLRDDTEAAAFDCQSSSLIKLNNGTILYLREVNKFLALVCIIDYNFLCFREAIQQVFELRNKSQMLVTINSNHHSNAISNQTTTVNSETQNSTLNAAAVQS